MKIALVGGIFGRDASHRSKHAVTPETVLLDGFQKAGVDVQPLGHAQFEPSDQYDIVHIHHFGKAALKMAVSNTKSRFVFTGHDGMIVTGYERSWARRQAFQYVLDKADALIALSQAEARYFENHGAVGKVHCIPNGIPSEIFSSHTIQKDDNGQRADKGRFDLLYVGQLIELKGVNFLLEAIQKVRLRHNAHLRLVYHNAERETEYKQMVQDLDIAQAVEFVGILGPSELAREYQAADLMVLPSLAECLPSVVTESLLAGTPVVASSVCGVPEQLDKYGIAVPPGNVPALVEAIETMIREQSRFQALAPEMRDYAEKKYKPATMVENHLALYKRLVAKSNSESLRKAFWMDPLVRLGISAYWGRGTQSQKKAVAK